MKILSRSNRYFCPGSIHLAKSSCWSGKFGDPYEVLDFDLALGEAPDVGLQSRVFPDEVGQFHGAVELFSGNGGAVEV
ncbi:hypothetical protein [Microbulbifer taiwanensis]|uniref:Uncharacterized protein n=1 Tax=Microbulbifer taiwanensis TaxID=986746 RepID=A0ABW1YJV1_9GAMM|nr:hypothetical protein [Microbulbifer taiwanensis]